MNDIWDKRVFSLSIFKLRSVSVRAGVCTKVRSCRTGSNSWVFSCGFDLHSKVLRVARHTVDPLFLHCRWIAETTQLDNIQFNLFIQPGLPRKFRLRPLWWFRKSSGFYSCRPPHCPVDASSLVCLQHRRHTGADVYPTDTSQ